jgi:hypothetical protein
MARNAEAADKGDKISDEIPNCKRRRWENDPCAWTNGINDRTTTPRDEGLELNPWRRAMAPGPETEKKCAQTSLRSERPPKSRRRNQRKTCPDRRFCYGILRATRLASGEHSNQAGTEIGTG